MREIKFRAWEKEHKVMFGVGGFANMDYDPVDKYRYVINDRASAGAKGGATHQIQKIVLMQYTGLKDKNGVEIYEGDVVTWRVNGNEWTHEIGFEAGHFQFINSNGDWFDPFRGEFEVIGNIYENPLNY